VKVAFFAFFCGFQVAMLFTSALSADAIGAAIDSFGVLWDAAFLALSLGERAGIA